MWSALLRHIQHRSALFTRVDGTDFDSSVDSIYLAEEYAVQSVTKNALNSKANVRNSGRCYANCFRSNDKSRKYGLKGTTSDNQNLKKISLKTFKYVIYNLFISSQSLINLVPSWFTFSMLVFFFILQN